MRVADLLGADLDYWVAKAWMDGASYVTVDASYVRDFDFHPSENWAQAGPIIERERIHLEPFPGGDEYPEWLAFEQSDGWGEPLADSPRRQYGDTALIAAMRAYVASKFGEEVEDAPREAGD